MNIHIYNMALPPQQIITYTPFDILFIGSQRYNIAEVVKKWIISLFCDNPSKEFWISRDPDLYNRIIDAICGNIHSLTTMWLALRRLCRRFNDIDIKTKCINLSSVKATGLLSGILLSNENDLANAHISLTCLSSNRGGGRRLLCNLCGEIYSWKHSPDVIKTGKLYGRDDYLQNVNMHANVCTKLIMAKMRNEKLFECKDCCTIVRPVAKSVSIMWKICPLSTGVCSLCKTTCYVIELETKKMTGGNHQSKHSCDNLPVWNSCSVMNKYCRPNYSDLKTYQWK